MSQTTPPLTYQPVSPHATPQQKTHIRFLYAFLISIVSLLMLTFAFKAAAGSPAASPPMSALPAAEDDGIHGMKFRDTDGDGVKDPDEPGISGWRITLEGEGLFRETFTDAGGRYWFTDLEAGTYVVEEEHRPGWEQTFPDEGSYTVSFVPTQPIDGLDFGNHPAEATGIHGMKFRDIDKDGQKDPDEPGIPGWEIRLEGEDGTVRETLTDIHGRYWFMDLDAGVYTVTEEIKSGWIQTFPDFDAYTFLYDPDQAIRHVDFGNAMEAPDGLHGTKFYDFNGNGERDPNEPGLPGWKIILESPELPNGTLMTFTDERGEYWFTDIPAGDYTLSEELRDGWIQTFPADGVHNIVYDPAQPIEGLNFGNQEEEPDGIHGVKFHDLNGNGQRDGNDPGLSGWTILLADAATGQLLEEAVTDDKGRYWFMGLPPGEYLVHEETQTGWVQTYPPFDEYQINFVPGRPVEHVDFGNFRPDPGEIHGVKFNDANGNSVRDGNEQPLGGWVIHLAGESFDGQEVVRQTTTNANGAYWFMELPPGVYMLREELQAGWVRTFPQSGFHTAVVEPGDVVDGLDFGNWQPDGAEIHGVKYHDLNGNGRRDPDEPGLAGWTIILEGENGLRRETTTDGQGRYWFMGLPPGTYDVGERLQDEWQQTAPDDPPFHRVTLEPGDVVEGVNFGNWEPGPGSIHGVKYHDLNANGIRDNGEPGLSGWTIRIEGENFSEEAQTDENGRYWFMDVPPGAYEIEEMPQDGWFQTFPFGGGNHVVELAIGEHVHGVNFGNADPDPGEIHGIKFNDADGNGVKGPNEPGLAGWTIILEGANVTRETTTDNQGRYWFMELPPGFYLVREVFQDGWYPTSPEYGFHYLELGAGDIIDDAHFGNWRPTPAEIHGTKFHDLNGNGRRDSGEPGLPGWTIVVEGEQGLRFETTTDADGNYWFMGLPPGTYHVIEQQQDGWQQTVPIPNVYVLELEAGEIVDGLDFGNFRPEPGEIHGMKFHDVDGDGVKDPNEPGLAGWTIVAEHEDGTRYETTTDADGRYWFMNLPPGRYDVGERRQDGWQQTYPENGFHTVQLASNQVIDGLDFGNRRPTPGSIHGVKFYDLDQDGERDPNEPGLPDWVILLIDRSGRVHHTRTDDDGNYWFEDVLPGEYLVTELMRYGWRQTLPAQGGYFLTLEPGQVEDGLDFGNWLDVDEDFCKIHWDLPFPNEESLETDVFIFNTSAVSQTYDLQLHGVPAGVNGSQADGPDTFDILEPMPVTLGPNTIKAVPIRVHYPVSFTQGFPGPAVFEAVVTNQATGTSFGCHAATWPATTVRAEPADDGVNAIPDGNTETVGFVVTNTETPDLMRGRAATVDYTIHAMTDGEDGPSSAISLNGLPAGNSVKGQLNLPEGADATLRVNASFIKATNGTSDILLELDLDGDGNADTIAAAVIQQTAADDKTQYLPAVFLP